MGEFFDTGHRVCGVWAILPYCSEWRCSCFNSSSVNHTKDWGVLQQWPAILKSKCLMEAFKPGPSSAVYQRLTKQQCEMSPTQLSRVVLNHCKWALLEIHWWAPSPSPSSSLLQDPGFDVHHDEDLSEQYSRVACRSRSPCPTLMGRIFIRESYNEMPESP